MNVLSKLKIKIVVILLVFAAFVLGVKQSTAVKNVYRQVFKNDANSSSTKHVEESNRYDSLMSYAFTDPLVAHPVLPKADNLEAIHANLDRLFVPYEQFYGSFDRLALGNGKLDADLYSLDYELGGKAFTASAYFAGAKSPREDSCGALIIPGTGKNQSSEIFNRTSGNYHGGIFKLANNRCDTYVLIKPNEDILAIHNGQKKLNYDFIKVYLLNVGGSYSAGYLIDSLALAKQISEAYDQFYLLGLSQGGQAALYNALQSKPDKAVISSGFSVLHEKLLWANAKQIMLPDIMTYYNNRKIQDDISTMATKYLFTYGRREDGPYGIEADEQLTCKYFSALENVSCEVHDGGHEFPEPLIERFLNQ